MSSKKPAWNYIKKVDDSAGFVAEGRFTVHIYFTECKHVAIESNCCRLADPTGVLAEHYFEHKVPSHCGCKDEV